MKDYYPEFDQFFDELDESFVPFPVPDVFPELPPDTSSPFGPSPAEIVARHWRHYPKCVYEGQVSLFDE